MKTISIILAWVLSLAQLEYARTAVNPFVNDSSSDSISETITKLDRELDDAFERGDVAVFQRVLADDLIIVNSDGSISRKPAMLKQIKPPKPGTKVSITATDVEVVSFGGTAIITGIKTAKTDYHDTSTTQRYRETNTYVQKDGSWLMVAQQDYEEPPYVAKDVQLSVNIDESQLSGNKKAQVVLIEFADYQCKYCRAFAAATMKQVESEYINKNRIGYFFYDFPIESSHPLAVKASVAGMCAGQQGKLADMNHRLMADPESLKPEDLMNHASELKLNMTKFRQCFEAKTTEDELRRKMSEAGKIGIFGTPTFLVGIRKPGSHTVKALRMIEGGYPFEVFKATIEGLISARE